MASRLLQAASVSAESPLPPRHVVFCSCHCDIRRMGWDAPLSVSMTLPVSEIIVPALWSQTRENSAVPEDTRSPTSRFAYQSTTPSILQVSEQVIRADPG